MPAETPRRILIVSVNWLGDLIFMTPALRAVRKRFAGAHLACLVPPRGVPLLSGNPHLDEVIPLAETRRPAAWAALLRAAGHLREKRFDTAILFHRSFSRTVLAWAAGIPCRIGYRTRKRGWLLTRSAPAPKPDTLHKVEWFLHLLRQVGIPPDGHRYEPGVTRADEARARALLSELGIGSGEPVAALHVGANWKLKRWPAARFAELGDRLSARRNVKILFVGGASDLPLIRSVTDRMKCRPAVAAGKTSFPELGAVLKRVRVLVSNDSGPLHMAVAVGTPVVAVFGPTAPTLTGLPEGAQGATFFGSIGCPVPCYQLRCPVNLCMERVTVDQVLEAAERFL